MKLLRLIRWSKKITAKENGVRRFKCLFGGLRESRKVEMISFHLFSAAVFLSGSNRKTKQKHNKKRITHIDGETTYIFELIIFGV